MSSTEPTQEPEDVVSIQLKQYPELMKHLELELCTIKLSGEHAILSAQKKVAVPTGGYEEHFANLLTTLPQKHRDAANRTVSSLEKASVAERNHFYGRAAEYMKRTEGVTIQNEVRQNNQVQSVFGISPQIPTGKIEPEPAKPPPPAHHYPDFRLMINEMVCEEESFPAFIGSDDMEIGGVAFELGNGTKAHPPRAKKVDFGEPTYEFDGGQKKHINRQFYSWSLAEGGHVWPKTFTAIITLCEKDSGNGWVSFVSKLADTAGDAIGNAVGDIASTVLGPIGELIGMAVGWLIKKIFGWLISLFEDYIYQPFIISKKFYGPKFLKDGKSEHLGHYWFRRDGHGQYYVTVYWELYDKKQ